MFDLDAYLERIGLRGRTSVSEVHRAHITSIPFENLDPHCGAPVSLALERLEQKLVAERRGGYCFEQNLLLKAALEALGAEVQLTLARVRLGAPAGTVRPRAHLLLRVREEGSDWHADVGFGIGSLFEPIPFGPGEERVQSGWRYRVLYEGPELVLQTVRGDEWVDAYSFAPHPVPFVDLETANWFTSTHPRSPFVSSLIASIQSDEGTRTVLSDWSELSLTEQTPAGDTISPVDWDAVPELLATRFGLHGYELDDDGRLVAARTTSRWHALD